MLSLLGAKATQHLHTSRASAFFFNKQLATMAIESYRSANCTSTKTPGCFGVKDQGVLSQKTRVFVEVTPGSFYSYTRSTTAILL